MRCAYLAANVGFSLENPRTSMIWGLSETFRPMQEPSAFMVELAHCAFGAKWAKPASPLTKATALKELVRRRSRDRAHQELRGRKSQGQL